MKGRVMMAIAKNQVETDQKTAQRFYRLAKKEVLPSKAKSEKT
jgi:hypothetical protein